MVGLLVQLEGVDPLVVAVRFALPDIVEVDFPEVDLPRVGSTRKEASLVDRERVDVLVPGAKAELLWTQLDHENLVVLALILLLRVGISVDDLPLPRLALDLSDGLHRGLGFPSFLRILDLLWSVDSIRVLVATCVELAVELLGKRTYVIYVDRAVVRASDEELVIVYLRGGLSTLVRAKVGDHRHIGGLLGILLRQIRLFLIQLHGNVLFLGLLGITWNHEKLDFVDLLSVRIGHPFHYFAFLEVPENQRAIFGARGHEAVAFAHLDVDDHVHVAVQRRLEDHGVFAPDFDDSTVNERDENEKL